MTWSLPGYLFFGTISGTLLVVGICDNDYLLIGLALPFLSVSAWCWRLLWGKWIP